MSITRWKERNGKDARSMAEAGVTVQQAVAFWQDEYARAGPVIMLVHLVERMQRQVNKPHDPTDDMLVLSLSDFPSRG